MKEEAHDPHVAKLVRMSDYFGKRVSEQSRGISLVKEELDGLWYSTGITADGHLTWSFRPRRHWPVPKKTA